MSGYCVGIDLGGTYIKFVLLDEDRRASEVTQRRTPTRQGADGVVEAMVAGASELLERQGCARSDVRGVGIGAPGPLSISEGIIHAMPNIAGMDGCPLRDRVGEGLNLPAVLENDANAAALGEFECGAGSEAHVMVLLTLGTGLGSGIVIDGKIVHGAHEIGGELGHMIVEPGGAECGCGQRGCLEQYCSATFLGKVAERRLAAEPERASSLRETLAKRGGLDAKAINEARAAGDPFAAELWDNGARRLALGCVNIARIFDPEIICFAGGMTAAGEDLLAPVRRHFRDQHWKLTEVKTEIVLSELGNDAGAIGAAAVAWQRG